jgi:hypothetical protein
VDIAQLIETLGIPVAVAIVLGYGCFYLIRFINGRLMEKLDEQNTRLESIIIKLIDSNNQEKQETLRHNTEILSRIDTLVTTMSSLTGNGLGKHNRRRADKK